MFHCVDSVLWSLSTQIMISICLYNNTIIIKRKQTTKRKVMFYPMLEMLDPLVSIQTTGTIYIIYYIYYIILCSISQTKLTPKRQWQIWLNKFVLLLIVSDILRLIHFIDLSHTYILSLSLSHSLNEDDNQVLN